MALSDFVSLAISISAAASPVVQAFNVGLIAAAHNNYPDRVRIYSTSTVLTQLVSDGFKVTDPAYKGASAYASSQAPPSLVAIGRRTLPPLQTVQLTCVDGTVGDAYAFTLVGSDGLSHALAYTNVINPGPAIPVAAALSGTVTVTNGSTAIVFSVAQTLAAGTLLTFSAQPGVSYVLPAAITSATAAVLSTPYTGASSSSGTTTTGATTAVTAGSTAVVFSVAQTLTKGTLLTFASQPGVYYALSANVTASTAGTLTAAYGGLTAAATNTQALAALAGTMGVTNGSSVVSTTSSQVGTVAVGDSVQFVSQLGTYYTVAAVSATQLTLTNGYAGVTNASTNACDVCQASTAATVLQATIAPMTNVGTPTVAGAVLTLSRTDGKLTDVQSWDSNGFYSIQLTDATADPGIATDLAAILAANKNAWYALLLDSNSSAEITSAAAFIEATGVAGKVLFANNSDYGNTQVATTSDVFSALKTSSYKRSFVGHNNTKLLSYEGAAACGYALGQNPGSYTLGFKTLPGVPADSDTTLTQSQALAINTMTAGNPGTGGKNGNYYKTQAGLNWLWPGVTPSGQFLDLTIFVDWLQANMQADVAAILASLPKLPYTDSGISLVRSAIDRRLRLGSTPQYGGILPDGQDPARPISVIVPKASAVSSTDRTNRNLSGTSWSAGLAGAIQTAVITGVLNP